MAVSAFERQTPVHRRPRPYHARNAARGAPRSDDGYEMRDTGAQEFKGKGDSTLIRGGWRTEEKSDSGAPGQSASVEN